MNLLRRLLRPTPSVPQTEAEKLASLPTLSFPTGSLRTFSAEDLAASLRENTDRWNRQESALAKHVSIEDGTTGGVNPGDRRAVWSLVAGLKPRRILEIGTHVGASTAHMAVAAAENGDSRIITVDILDQVDGIDASWKRFGLTQSPKDRLTALGCADVVEFVKADSFDYMSRSKDQFDLIFLDGDHGATTVYREMSVALRLLAPGGFILLHDYFRDGRPLWSDGSVIEGPYLGLKRIMNEGAALQVLPLGQLPWPTKLKSNVTSLALVVARP